MDADRNKVLLMAAYQMLKKCEQSSHVQSVLEVTADYDGTVCDGYCLMEDIEIALELGAYAPEA